MKLGTVVPVVGSLALLVGAGCGGRSLLNGAPGGTSEPIADAGSQDTGVIVGHFEGGVTETGPCDFCQPESGLFEGGFDVMVPKEASFFDISIGPDTTGVETSFPFPAAFPAPPQVLNLGSPPLETPQLVVVMFNNDDPSELPEIQDFFTGITSSKYWLGLSEYKVGAALPTQFISLAEAAPASLDDSAQEGETSALQSWLTSEISSGNIPPPDANTAYMLVFPSTTTLTADGTTLCGQSGVGGYHTDFLAALSSGSTPIAYGVLPRCQAMQGLTEMQVFTGATSHEIIEAVTDPFPNLSPSWEQDDDAHLFWQEADSGSEIGDMCEIQPEAFFQFPDFPFVVQRYWSNAAALAGSDPCVPEYSGETYFNAAPELPDSITVSGQGGSATLSSKKIAVGSSGTVVLDLYSEGPTQPWTVTVQDYNALQTQDPSQALLSFSMPQTTGQNGTKIPLTITVNTAGNQSSNGQLDNTELFLIESSQGTGSSQIINLWWGFVSN